MVVLPGTETDAPGVGPAPSPLGSVDKALLALEHLAAAGPRGVPLGTLAADLGLNKTSLHRTLAALRFRGYAEQDPATGSYRLGPAATALGNVFLGEEHLPALLTPALTAVCEATGELTHLGVLSGPEIVYLDKVEPARAVRVWSAIGRRRPAATTALGRALLAHRATDRSAMGWYTAAASDTSPGAQDSLWETLRTTRARGYATETEENEPGISCLAVPLLRAGQAVAALSVTAPADRMDETRHVELARTIDTVARPLLPASLTLPAEIASPGR
ncbi:IclR family transcriptional regulator [Oerskovia jenensis]|uniref:DNA-binding IclR family transcriptional regulator n=1 Tax=Oerskovia jenensis TaxID=162169 RepID=A0ABS2LCC3_9CELL|nr:IclR family transcriptional regulator [Oerskovia jenensis]MBM7478086.1 DNA-binding IclR family transcriptional regulator [Oerskovia jenensis]